MKKVVGLMLALLCLASCSSDDTPKKPTVSFDQLPKKWYYVATVVSGSAQAYTGHTACAKDYLEFQVSTTVKKVDYTTCQDDPTIGTGTYTVDVQTKKVTTVINGETITYTINKLNSKELEAVTTYNGLEIGYVFTSIP